MTWLMRLACAALLTCTLSTAVAQPVQYAIGRCFDQVYGVVLDVTPDLQVWNANNQSNIGQGLRDPSGMYYLRIPALEPWRNSFFISWNLQIVQLSIDLPAPRVIGTCNFEANAIPQPIVLPQFDTRPAQDRAVLGPNGQLLRVPQFLEINRSAISMPGIASPGNAQACFNATGPDKEEFAACMLPKMLTHTQVKAYKCTKRKDKSDETDKVLVSACLAKQIVGPNEARAIDQSMKCYKEHKKDYRKYPLCMAEQNFDEKTAATVACFTDRSKQGDVSPWSTAACAAGAQLGFNPELTIAVECAVTTHGEPYSFVSCTAGRLTARELDKCFTKGIGGDGCFGPNNDIVKGLRQFGIDVGNLTNPNGAVVNAWNTVTNDVRNGPGANNDIVRAVDTINNDLKNGPGPNNDIVKAAQQIGLGGIFGF
jgi:hypothetical protein